MESNPQYSLASSNRGTSACSKRVVPHVFKMKRLLETNMLLSLYKKKLRTRKYTFTKCLQVVIANVHWTDQGPFICRFMYKIQSAGQTGSLDADHHNPTFLFALLLLHSAIRERKAKPYVSYKLSERFSSHRALNYRVIEMIHLLSHAPLYPEFKFST